VLVEWFYCLACVQRGRSQTLSFGTIEDRRERAQCFLNVQRDRVAGVEEQLLDATGDILPESADSKTATELAVLCRLLQEATRQKMRLLKTRLELMGCNEIKWEEPPRRSSPTITTPKQAAASAAEVNNWFSMGGPLESVIEGDVETEGATTPGSMFQPSPFCSHKKKPRKQSLTPTTPTMDSFSFR
jgi:hypothetical protein